LSLTERVAVRDPAAVGLKVTLIVQFPPAARLEPQVLVCAKSPGFVPVRLMLLMVSVAFPLLLNVTALAPLVVKFNCAEKVRDVGERPAVGPTPVPVREAVCGLPEALSLTDKVALRDPAAVGLKVTLIVQFPPAATLEPQVLV